ncbi:FAD-dependent oxidoreductase [Desulfobaculum bizertense]|uniref:Electron transfer flavoprotein-quinone oxidoreductase n=1 Tax=Desulfobaculum bizertense DSM 18034 TaxID=1121442 RepID=A0A1T4VQ87_9BACT|nr:FAD-dependent oxidoreductase [Desulfobaculum bizertense]UIJ38261.1 FAD-dependent oxidoreductase [Desulfobaculum bizertense]SKA67035.1 electron transfer flavoprotein-quinone oxidoreductase [Desulfobaculum bizertense DSM 18034]
MSEDKFDVIIVGGGLAGCTSAYLLAKAGLETLVIERGNFSGAKNMTGGRLYAHSLEKIFPNFAEEAPVERCITHEKISFMTEESSTTMDYAAPAADDQANRSYSVLRSSFDQWLASKAEDAGANMIPGIRVDDLIVRDGKVCGVIAAEEEMEADMVILADGVNSILGEKLGMVSKVTPHNCAVGVKEVIELGKKQVNDRFGCADGEGAAWLFAGMPSDGHMGGGFLYTNEETVSLGVVFGLHNIEKAGKSVPQMLEDFKNHPTIKPLIEGGKQIEYSAHVVPEGGLGMVPQLVGDGVLIAGDAAGLCLNVGYTVRGMDLAIASGEAAAKAIIAAKEKGDFSASALEQYKKDIEESFVMKDLELYKKLPGFLDNPRMFNDYPEMVEGIMKDLFTINGPSVALRKKIMPHLKKVGFLNLMKDAFKGVGSI